jgi:N-glycosylase/DNA lyase
MKDSEVSRTKIYSARLTIPTPSNFDFWRTAYSHGWCDLVPFSFDLETQELRRILSVHGDVPVACTLRATDRTVTVNTTSSLPLSPRQRADVIAQLRSCLRLDEEFDTFHKEARKHEEFRWIAPSGSGRLLRSPTVFEDVVKMICTTNCTWALTKIMVTNLVEAFGKKFADGKYTFPQPEAIAASTERFLRTKVKAGYRAPFLLELARRVASGKLDIESWRSSSLPTEELFEEMRGVKGVGPYAAGNILKLVGRYDYLGLDSWVRQQFYKMHKNGRKVKDATIEKHYARFGKWRGLFFWLEMTRYWHDEKFPEEDEWTGNEHRK